jgi:hypothetical protein
MDGDIGSNPISILHSQNFPQFHRKLRRTLTTIEPLNSVMGSCLAPNLLLHSSAVERLTVNQDVRGSIPREAANYASVV